jgi:hypothetical protein
VPGPGRNLSQQMSSSIWKSPTFWAFAGVSGGVASGAAYDRFKAKQLTEEFMTQARQYGQKPLYEGQHPPCLSLFALAPDSDASEAIRSLFKQYAVKILTAAGVDYVWAVAGDQEQVTKEWNRIAQDSNAPEKMLDEGKLVDSAVLREQILKNTLLAHLGRQVSFSDSLWSSVQEKLVQQQRPWSPNFVALSESTLTGLSECLSEIKSELPLDAEKPMPASKRTWFSRTQELPSKPVDPSILHLDCISLRLLNCEQPMSFMNRTWRFLFGQCELVRSVGTSTMSIIRSLNDE